MVLLIISLRKSGRKISISALRLNTIKSYCKKRNDISLLINKWFKSINKINMSFHYWGTPH